MASKKNVLLAVLIPLAALILAGGAFWYFLEREHSAGFSLGAPQPGQARDGSGGTLPPQTSSHPPSRLPPLSPGSYAQASGPGEDPTRFPDDPDFLSNAWREPLAELDSEAEEVPADIPQIRSEPIPSEIVDDVADSTEPWNQRFPLAQDAIGTPPALPSVDSSGSSVSEAHPLTPEGNIVAGQYSRSQGTVRFQGGKAGSSQHGLPEDGVLGMGFIDDLSIFLVDNFWPAGTHPKAVSRPASTADLQWANLKYGAALDGFQVDRNRPEFSRRRLLNYILSPSMVDGLYDLYVDRFILSLEREAAGRVRMLGGNERALTMQETGQMFSLYARQARSLATALRIYFADPDSPALVRAYIDSDDQAAKAYLDYTHGLQESTKNPDAARAYQSAVVRREQARQAIAASLRRGGSVSALDTETLIFAVMWLHRRSAAERPALEAMAGVLDRLAERLDLRSSELGGTR